MTTSTPEPGEQIPTTAAEDVLRDVETQVDAFEADLENNLYKVWNVRSEC